MFTSVLSQLINFQLDTDVPSMKPWNWLFKAFYVTREDRHQLTTVTRIGFSWSIVLFSTWNMTFSASLVSFVVGNFAIMDQLYLFLSTSLSWINCIECSRLLSSACAASELITSLRVDQRTKSDLSAESLVDWLTWGTETFTCQLELLIGQIVYRSPQKVSSPSGLNRLAIEI